MEHKNKNKPFAFISFRDFARTCLMLIAALTAMIPNHTAKGADVTLAWDPSVGPDITGYRLYLGTASGVYIQTSDVGINTSTMVSNLTVGQTYYFVVTAYTSSGLESPPSNEVSFTPTSSPTPGPSPTPGIGPAQMLTPIPGASLSSGTVTFNWTSGSATDYVLLVGSSSGVGDYYSSGILSTLSSLATNLPTDGRMIYVTLGSKLNGSWTFNQYTYNAFNAGSRPTSSPRTSTKSLPTTPRRSYRHVSQNHPRVLPDDIPEDGNK
jgi:Fibronectin type III domain